MGRSQATQPYSRYHRARGPGFGRRLLKIKVLEGNLLPAVDRFDVDKLRFGSGNGHWGKTT